MIFEEHIVMAKVKNRAILVLFILAAILVIVFVMHGRYSHWNLTPNSDFSKDAYWNGYQLTYSGLFKPTIEDIVVSYDGEFVCSPLIDENENLISTTFDEYNNFIQTNKFDFISPSGYKVKNADKSVVIGIVQERLETHEGPYYLEISYRLFLINFTENVLIPER